MQKKTFIKITCWILVDIALLVVLVLFFTGEDKMKASIPILLVIVALIVGFIFEVIRLYVKDKILSSNQEKEVIEMQGIVCDTKWGALMQLTMMIGLLGGLVYDKYYGTLDTFRTIGVVLVALSLAVDVIRDIIKNRKTKKELSKWSIDGKTSSKG